MAFVGTTTTLGNAGEYDSVWRESLDYDNIVGTVASDQSGTIYIEQSPDAINADVSTSYAIVGGDGKGFEESIVAPFWRIRYVNGATPQTSFRLTARTTGVGDS